jgi:Fe-S cluster assembly protein SufB
MSAIRETADQVATLGEKYKYGFVTDIEMEVTPKGLNEDVVRLISARRTSRNGCWNGGSARSAAGWK